jgi:Nucleoside-diphosphate-sugar epimerases
MTTSNPKFIITGGAGFIGSNLTLALQEKFPDAHLTVIDDFRSGDFKNLAGYGGDFVAENLATLDWREKFGDSASAGFDAIFHLASITDTTLHDQFVQVHDNVESFRRLLNFARPTKTRIIYASSAATYGPATEASVESNGAAPANVYAFSKVIMDNIARGAAADVAGLDYRRAALLQRLRTVRSAQGRASEHGLSPGATDEGRQAAAHFQARRAETRFRLRKGRR